MDHDVIVIGGGAAGLSGAIALARSKRPVLVLDSGQPRNAPAHGVHGFLGHDGVAPQELLRRGRAEFESYGGTVHTARVRQIERIDGAFRVDGVTARRLLVATGLTDVLPDVPGLREQWGTGVVHCPYCHGWEVRDQPLVLIGTNAMAPHSALLFSQLTADLTLLRHDAPDPDEADRAKLTARGVTIDDRRAAAVESADGAVTGVRLTDGALLPCAAVVVSSELRANAAFLAGLGLAVEDFVINGHVLGEVLPTEPTGRTTVPGVWAAGNVRDPMAQVVHAAGDGLRVGAMINLDLIEADASG